MKARSVRTETTAEVSESLRRMLARGLNRHDAALYVGVSATHFDEMVRDGRMPQPKVSGSRVIWDRHKLDAYFSELTERGGDEEDAADGWADFQ